MVRPLRLEYPGAIYHITSRGNDRQEIFRDEADRYTFFDQLAKVASRFRWKYLAYCLMDNHYHLVAETPNANLSQGMCCLNSNYARRFNKKYGKSGHLFQSRYKALIVERDSYLLEVLRYTVLNPVRAGLCVRPQDFAYSSYNETCGKVSANGLIKTDQILSLFGRTKKAAIVRYLEFVSNGAGQESLDNQVRAGVFLGSDSFVDKHTIDLADESLREIHSSQKPDPKPPLRHLITDVKDKHAVYQAYCEWGYSMRQIADVLDVHHSTISRSIKSYEEAFGLS